MEKRPSTPPAEWFQVLYERHFDFVWRTLRHLGVREADLSDACQDVFIVVHRRFPSFESRGKVSTWLFQICLNTARDRRRRVHARTEVLGDEAIEHAAGTAVDPFSEGEREDKLALFESALRNMDFDQRAAFVLFEIEGMTGPEAAAILGVPLGTAYSRLRLARRAFVAAVERAHKDPVVFHARGGAR
ncbi:MAG TPA: sigma-70 family RNA polymerase sigma factor [Polyangiaceae bacterium]|nr:sigma-70 family RNA polymerase sigma factor [Polyangiaceae bacterium]